MVNKGGNKMNIKQIAYEKYKLDWLLKHGYTLADLMNELDKMQEESLDDSVSQLFTDWEYGFGFGSEVWVCYEEFLESEYQNAFYMLQLLSWEESEEYKKDIKFEEESEMKIRYHICGIGYDKNDCVTDYETNLGDFDDYEEAYEEFVKLQCEDVRGFFNRVPNIYQILIQLEECEETDEEITCIDVNNEWWIINPNYKEEN
jgi:hypothetical protein